MLRALTTALLIALFAAIVVIAAANRQTVTLTYNVLENARHTSVDVPLYLVVFASIGVGVVLGGVGARLGRKPEQRRSAHRATAPKRRPRSSSSLAQGALEAPSRG